MPIQMDTKDFFNMMDKFKKNVVDGSQVALQKTAREIVQTMKSLVPVDTGELRDSIRFEVMETGVEVIAGADHASYVNFGTLNMPSREFFDPSIDAHRQDLSKYINQELMRGIK